MTFGRGIDDVLIAISVGVLESLIRGQTSARIAIRLEKCPRRDMPISICVGQSSDHVMALNLTKIVIGHQSPAARDM